MVEIKKDAALSQQNIAFGYVEVRYPERSQWNEEAFRELVEEELDNLKRRFSEYDRELVFEMNPYYSFFKKFRKTYPVMLQFESVVRKGRPFPNRNPVIEVPYLMELMTQVLSGTHDADALQGTVELFLGTEKEPFTGIGGKPVHTYPGDICGRDEGGIIFSAVAGADERTCARNDSRHVIYPVFGTPGMPVEVIEDLLQILVGYVRVLAPTAEIETAVL